MFGIIHLVCLVYTGVMAPDASGVILPVGCLTVCLVLFLGLFLYLLRGFLSWGWVFFLGGLTRLTAL